MCPFFPPHQLEIQKIFQWSIFPYHTGVCRHRKVQERVTHIVVHHRACLCVFTDCLLNAGGKKGNTFMEKLLSATVLTLMQTQVHQDSQVEFNHRKIL